MFKRKLFLKIKVVACDVLRRIKNRSLTSRSCSVQVAVQRLDIMLAISYGSTVTLWDHQRNHELQSFQPISYSSPISEVCWSNDGKKLASCSSIDSRQPNISISSVEDKSSTLKSLAFHSSRNKFSDSPSPTSPSSNATSVSFGGSRYLCVADNDISIFDLKKYGRVRKLSLSSVGSSYQQKRARIKACISGSVVAASSDLDATLYLYQLRGADSMAPTMLKMSSSDQPTGCSALSFPNASYYAAAGMLNGAINMCDVEKQALGCSIDASQYPIADLCISPVNSRLLASISHESLLFHDANSAKSISTMSIGARCNSLSLSNDGVSCAVGTSIGTVLLYDLRKSGSPMTQWDGNDKYLEPVNSVRFRPETSSLMTSTRKFKENIVIEDDECDEDEASRDGIGAGSAHCPYELPDEYEETSFLLGVARTGSLSTSTKRHDLERLNDNGNDENDPLQLSSDNAKGKGNDDSHDHDRPEQYLMSMMNKVRHTS